MQDVAQITERESPGVTEAGLSGRSRYDRLDVVDRHSAERLNEYCRVNSRQDVAAVRLSNWAMWQSLATSLPLALSDWLALGASIVLATGIMERLLDISTMQIETNKALLMSLVILPIAHLAGLYPGLGLGAIVEFRQLARSISASCLLFGGIGFFALPGSAWFYVSATLLTLVIALPVTMMARFLVQNMAKHFAWWGAPTLIIAEPQRALGIYRRLAAKLEHGFRPVGVLLDNSRYWAEGGAEFLERHGIPVYELRRADEAALACRSTWVLASPCAELDRTPALDPTLAAIPNRVLLASNQLDLGMWDQPLRVGDSNGLLVSGARPNSCELALKRGLDLVLTSLAVVAGLPALLLICTCIRLSSRGPILYGQRRLGRGGREFTAWKFRTMQMNADQVLQAYLDVHPEAQREWEEKHKLTKDPRVTQIGRLLRATSLDEIPQLWNVLRGDTSLVGPRPIVDSPTYDACYVHDYPDEYMAYKSVRPGLTGLWQVRCRNSGVYDLRIYWDMYYIRNWSIWLDLYLIMRTIKTVVFREGAY